MSKKEISIETIKQIAKEELQEYLDDDLSEDNLRKTIKEQLDISGKDIIFKQLGLRWDSWNHKWELDNGYGGLNKIIEKQKPVIIDIGTKVIKEVIKDITPEDVLISLNKNNIQSLKKVYRETLFNYFVEEVRNLAKIHGKENAERLFKEYLNEEETES